MSDKGKTARLFINNLMEMSRRIKRLEEAAEQLQRWLEATRGAPALCRPDGTYLSIPASFERITGYGKDAFFANSLLLAHIAHPEDRDTVSGHLHGNGQPGGDAIVFRSTTQAGHTRWVSMHSTSVYAGDGSLQGRRSTLRDITGQKQAELEKEALVAKLTEALENVKTLKEFIPICSCCKKIRDHKGYWQQLEEFMRNHGNMEFTHGLCPDCIEKLYPEYCRRTG